MIRFVPTTALSLLLLTGALPAPSAEAQTEVDFEWQGRVPVGQAIEIRGVQGRIVAELASGDAVEVTARKSGRRDDPAEVRIEVVPHADGVTLCAVYPTPHRTRRENRCGPEGTYSMSTDNHDVQVDFVVRVPAGVRLVAANVSGNVDARGLRSEVDARTVSGRVDVSTSESASVQSVSGSVTATLGSLAGSGTLAFKTVSGNVTVTLPPDAGARVSMKTVSGRFDTDFPMMTQGRISARQLDGTIGGGGRSIEMATVSGNVRLRRDD
jgi:hypothetical protein